MTPARFVVLVSRIHVYFHEKVEQLRYLPDYLDLDRVKATRRIRFIFFLFFLFISVSSFNILSQFVFK
jgi:hypothetical protein